MYVGNRDGRSEPADEHDAYSPVTNLVSNTSVILQKIVIVKTLGESNLLCDWQDISQMLVRELVHLLRMIWEDGTDVKVSLTSRRIKSTNR